MEDNDDGFTKPDFVYKVVLCGDSGVGKTSFLCQLVDNEMPKTMSSTVGIDLRIMNLTSKQCPALGNNKTCKINIWDTAGQERFHSIVKTHFRDAAAVFFMYDLTSMETLHNVLDRWIPLALGAMDPSKAHMGFLVGCKSDQVDSRMVTKEYSDEAAEQNNLTPLETSATSHSDCVDALMAAINALLKRDNAIIQNDKRAFYNNSSSETISLKQKEEEEGQPRKVSSSSCC